MKNMKNKKTIVVCNFPRFVDTLWMPILWTQAKTYYERNGDKVDEWYWHPSYFDIYSVEYIDEIKSLLLEAKPDVFAISLYVWNYSLSHQVAEWVKTQFPKCLIISGGPHQYFKHDQEWFKKHWYLDASLPGECYGELAFKEILDNYDDDGVVDWTKVTDIRYPKGKTRRIATSPLSMARSYKKSYDYDWAASEAQLEGLKLFADYKNKVFPKSHLLAMIETTRGCPYGCTYCDWGGGTSTTVIKKDLETVKRDVDALANFHLQLVYICDANFGVFGDRDVNIIKYIASKRMISGYDFQVLYGGFAKTENKLEYIRQIVEFDVDHKLSHTDEIKLSLQTIDPEILKNIDRVNIPLDKQLEVYKPIAANNRIPFYVEIIMGLPGMTLDKFYYECDVFGENNLSMMWFHWVLMPETPAYDRSYKDKFGLRSIVKTNGWQQGEATSHYEVVVEAKSYTNRDYLQMLLSTSMYNLIVQGGYYKNTLDWVVKNHNLGIGGIMRDMYDNFYMQSSHCRQWREQLFAEWDNILIDQDQPCVFTIDGKEVFGGWYFIAIAFLYHDQFTTNLMNWLQNKYDIPQHIINSDTELTIHNGNFDTTMRNGIVVTDFRKKITRNKSFTGGNLESVIDFLYRLYRDSGNISRAKKRLFGLIPL
jgi:putative methyltransferase